MAQLRRLPLAAGAVAGLALGACGDPTGDNGPPWPADPLQFDGPFEIIAEPKYQTAPTEPVFLWLMGRNVGTVAGQVTRGRCSLGVEVYTASTRTGAPFWSSRARDTETCTPGAKFEDTLTPQITMHLDIDTFSGADIGAPSAPTRYYFVVVYRDRAGVHRLPAGEKDLSR